LDQVESEVKRLQRAGERRYRELVVQICDGQITDPVQIAGVLHELQKPLGSVKVDVELLRARRGNRAIVDQRPEKESRRDELKRALDEEARRFAPLLTAHQELQSKMNGEVQAINAFFSTADVAANSLRQTAPAELMEEFRELNKKINSLGQRVPPLREEYNEASGHAANYRRQATATGDVSALRRQEASDNAASYGAKATGIERDLAQLTNKIAALEAEQAALLERMMQP